MIEAKVTENEVPRAMKLAAEAVEQTFYGIADDLVEMLGLTAPEGDESDNEEQLKDSFFWQKSSGDEFLVSSHKEYAEWRRTGTGEYVGNERIKPDTAKALKFYWPKAGQMTVWKGDLKGPVDEANFISWAFENGMLPFTIWPKGIPPSDYVDEAIDRTEEHAEGILQAEWNERGL